MRRTKCKEIFIALQKRDPGMALRARGTPKGVRPLAISVSLRNEAGARGLTPSGWDIKKGPLEDERPKSREETPKVGYDTSGSDQTCR